MSPVQRLQDRLSRRLRLERRSGRGGGRRRTDEEANRGWIPAVAVALGIAAVDWTTKFLIARSIPLGARVEVVDGRLSFWHVRNDAMILGLYGNLPLQARQGIAILSAVLGALLLFEVISRGHRLAPRHRWWAWLFVGLASGGMLGNLGERAVHWGVTDFLSLGVGGLWLPPGNVADLALFLSIPVAVVVIGFELAARARRAREAEEARRLATATVRDGG